MIYLDYQATTPLAPEARAAMLPWLDDGIGNPNSQHRPGRAAAAAVAVARAQVSAALQGSGEGPVSGGRLVFTSGATEAANLAIKGVAARAPVDRRHIVTIATEHACVLDSCAWLERQGWRVTRLGVDANGLVDLAEAAAAIDRQTALVAAMLVNNEIGVVQPVAALGKLAHAAGATMFCDAVQGFGRLDVPAADCDLIAISAHKIYGPAGVGALWIRDGVELEPLIHGGGQEGSLRSGTLSPALCAGFGAAAASAMRDRDADADKTEALRACFAPLLTDGWILNGSSSARWRGNLNIRRDGVDAARLMSELRGLAFSAGSACASGSGRPSHVLAALGLTDAQARASIRLGFGRYTTIYEVDEAVALIRAAVDRQLHLAA